MSSVPEVESKKIPTFTNELTIRAIKGNKRGADLDVIALLRKLDTPALRGSFMSKLTKDDYKAQFKSKPLQDLGFFQSTRGLGLRKTKKI